LRQLTQKYFVTQFGIAMASEEFVAFIDDDAIPEPECLNQAVVGFSSLPTDGKHRT
jgi:cellulose synthase/poly-beta-1,6-N-acetylglucosamine synthase-like glycosyltransferase